MNSTNASGQTALHIAVATSNVAVVKVLLGAGASVKSTTANGATPLHYAVLYRHKAVVELLLAAHSNPNARNSKGETALHLAVLTHDWAVVEMLLDHGADVSLADGRGNTPLSVAQRTSPSLYALLQNRSGPKDLRLRFDGADKRGWLAKMGRAASVRVWRMRFCTLYGPVFAYYTSPRDRMPSMELATSDEGIFFESVPGGIGKQRHVMRVFVTGGRALPNGSDSVHFAAETETDLQAWLTAIAAASGRAAAAVPTGGPGGASGAMATRGGGDARGAGVGAGDEATGARGKNFLALETATRYVVDELAESPDLPAVFRAPDSAEVQVLRDAFLAGRGVNLSRGPPAKAVARFLLWLVNAGLPQSIVTFQHASAFLASSELTSLEERVARLVSLRAQLDAGEQQLMRVFLTFLWRLHRRAKVNGMEMTQVASLFGFALAGRRHATAAETDSADRPAVLSLINIMVRAFARLYPEVVDGEVAAAQDAQLTAFRRHIGTEGMLFMLKLDVKRTETMLDAMLPLSIEAWKSVGAHCERLAHQAEELAEASRLAFRKLDIICEETAERIERQPCVWGDWPDERELLDSDSIATESDFDSSFFEGESSSTDDDL